MHNGVIGGFDRVRRALTLAIDNALYTCLQGTTDSEAFFYLLLSNGLERDPIAAFERTVGQVLAALAEAGVEEPFKMTAAVSEGHAITALRFASDNEAPSLFYGCGVAPHDESGTPVGSAGASVLILSEPLDRREDQWIEVPECHVLVAGDGGIAIPPFTPAAA